MPVHGRGKYPRPPTPGGTSAVTPAAGLAGGSTIGKHPKRSNYGCARQPEGITVHCDLNITIPTEVSTPIKVPPRWRQSRLSCPGSFRGPDEGVAKGSCQAPVGEPWSLSISEARGLQVIRFTHHGDVNGKGDCSHRGNCWSSCVNARAVARCSAPDVR